MGSRLMLAELDGGFEVHSTGTLLRNSKSEYDELLSSRKFYSRL